MYRWEKALRWWADDFLGLEADGVSANPKTFKKGQEVGYWPGHVLEFFGGEESGFLKQARLLIEEARQQNTQSAYIDCAEGFGNVHLGLHVSEILYLKPSVIEEIFKMIQVLEKGGIRLIILNSFFSLPTKSEKSAALFKSSWPKRQQQIQSEFGRWVDFVREKKICLVLFNPTNNDRETLSLLFERDCSVQRSVSRFEQRFDRAQNEPEHSRLYRFPREPKADARRGHLHGFFELCKGVLGR